jgi:hypothetical protein
MYQLMTKRRQLSFNAASNISVDVMRFLCRGKLNHCTVKLENNLSYSAFVGFWPLKKLVELTDRRTLCT